MRRKATFVLTGVLIVCSIVAAYAAVEIRSEGTKVGPTDKIDMYGPTITQSGGLTTVDVTALTEVTVAGDVYADTGLIVDGSIYLTGADGMYKPLLITQPDGGCSMCGVDAAGTTFSCVDRACPAGMTR